MSQANLLRLLEENINQLEKRIINIDKEDEVLNIIWKNALSRNDIIKVLGVSLKSVTVSLAKLYLQDKIIKLKGDNDRRLKKYVIRNESTEHLVNIRINK